ncbi:MAG: 50S ribosomal protein L3 glutamine methyltransferase [Rhodocyclaceae bacterium]|nr:MAG: 50S ribosomal protein L3 N(5)-glutamine methyltransferase [Rhodocyclaceae bacterium]MBE7422115.1 50S ribosomal protein L3 N(5)-glutamine methyltransferase [Zoogloeaceae bacterium]MBV6408202.1 50S ribosomal protein L3 glutamine methyltransferase [Rhodocyclaceae bacterium]MCK6383542.1 50S ribosomal protein L3 N(5)-glutamine methyltransferase [Rhodocyclaceae bacterium]CAG0927071.1 50S ribosomal protein L3 glutamine methyltransferase [Rhodocyclaceae bacterium]
MIPAELLTLRDMLRWAVSRFNAAGLFFGHGTQDAYDEAAWLVLHALHLPPDRLEPFLDARLAAAEKEAVAALIDRRIAERIPAAYLTHEAWLGDYRFHVDERVIVPRSHIAGLLMEDALAPWIDAGAVEDALDLCTGSGCLAVLLGLTFPGARVDAVDLSEDALAVARRNVADYGLDARIALHRSDLFAALDGRRYDLIVSNPPYVTAAAMRALPPEYRHEPALALAAGEDGLDIVRRLLDDAGKHLKPGGVLVVEVGDGRDAVEQSFPSLDPVWLDGGDDGKGVFLLRQEALS